MNEKVRTLPNSRYTLYLKCTVHKMKHHYLRRSDRILWVFILLLLLLVPVSGLWLWHSRDNSSLFTVVAWHHKTVSKSINSRTATRCQIQEE